MWRKIGEILLVIIGFFLLIDALVWHGISFDYSTIGLAWLDPYVSHGVIGFILMIIGMVDYEYS